MGELALKNPHGLKVGDKLLAAGRNYEREVEVVKVGRVWATINAGHYSTARVSLEDLSVHDDDRFYARVYLSREHRLEVEAAEAEERYLRECWAAFCARVHVWSQPKHLDAATLKTAADALGIALPAPPTHGGKEP